MSSFLEVMENLGYPSDVYLKYTATKNALQQVSESQLQRALAQNKRTFTRRFNKINGTSLSGEQIADMLDDFTTNGTIGQKVVSKMDEILNFQQGSNGIAENVSTSGGVSLSTTEGQIYLSQALSAFNGAKGKSLDNISNIVTGVDNAIDSMIEVLAESEFPAYAAVLLNSYYSGGVLSSRAQALVKKYNLSSVSISDSDTAKLDANAATIRENINALQSISKSATWGGDNGTHALYSKAIESIKSCFNSLGGTVNEMAYAWGLCTALYTGEQAIKKINPGTSEFVEVVQSSWTGQAGADSLPEGQELKSDTVVTYTRDGITVQIGGSIKLRQNAAFRGQGGKNSQALGVGGLIARGETYKSLKDRMESYAPGLYESGYDMVALEDPSGEDVTASWYGLKQLAGALTFLDALSGLGQSIEDFSSLFIVNNRIFSVYDILDKLTNQAALQLTSGAKKGYIVDGFDLNKINASIMKESQKEELSTVQKAALRNKYARSELANAKIQITLNLGNLYGSDIFK